MNADLEALLRQPWAARRRRAGDLVEVRVEVADGRPVCTVGVLCGHQGGDALTSDLARVLAALPAMRAALQEIDVGLEVFMQRYGDYSGRLAGLRDLILSTLTTLEPDA